MPIEKEFDILQFSKKLFGLSGAEIAFVAREGAYNCLRKNVEVKKIIAQNNIDEIDFDKLIIRADDFEAALKKSEMTPHNPQINRTPFSKRHLCGF